MTDLSVLSRTETDPVGKRGQILEGARRVFLNSGFDAASMNEIARVAGVSKGTLYVYFDSKEALFEALIREEKRVQAEQICRFDDNDPDLRSALLKFGYNLLSLVLEPSRVAQLRTIIAVSAKFPRIGQAFYESGPRLGAERLAGFLRKRAAADHLVIEDFERAAYHFGDMCKSRYVLRAILCVEAPPSEDDRRTHIAETVDVFLRAYQAR